MASYLIYRTVEKKRKKVIVNDKEYTLLKENHKLYQMVLFLEEKLNSYLLEEEKD